MLPRSKAVDHLLGGEDLLVAMAPAEAHQIVAQRLRQVAHAAIGLDAERAMTLRELGAVRSVDERDMRHLRHVPAQRLVDLRLAGRVGEVVVAADDMGHVHVVIVDHDGEHVGRRAVGAKQDEIVEILVLPHDPALDLVLDDRLALGRRLEADHRLHAGRRLGRIAVAPAAVIARGRPSRAGGLAHLLELLLAWHSSNRRGPAPAALGDLAVAGGAGELVDHVAVPIEAEPFQPVDDGLRWRRRSSAPGRYPRSAAASCPRAAWHRAS